MRPRMGSPATPTATPSPCRNRAPWQRGGLLLRRRGPVGAIAHAGVRVGESRHSWPAPALHLKSERAGAALHLEAGGLAPHRDACSTHTGGVLANRRWFASASERTTGTRHAQTRTPAGVLARISTRR